MKRIADFLAPLGLGLVAGALVAQRYGVVLPGGLRPFLVAGLLLVLAQVALRFDDVKKTFAGRQARYGTNAAVMVVVVLAILVGLNYLASRRSIRKDFTKGQRYSLSEQTKQVVSSLQEDVRVLYFQRASDMPRRGAGELEQYEALSPRVKVEYIDPLVDPARAREYEVRGPYPVIVLERGERRARASSGKEQELTSAFIKVTRSGRKSVCFTEGAGERDPDDSAEGGLSSAKAALTESLYATRKVSLVREAKVPEDCHVVVLASPSTDLLPGVVEALQAFVKKGGKVLVLSDPDPKDARKALRTLLQGWSIESGHDVVVDVRAAQDPRLGPFIALAPRKQEYPYHEITRSFALSTAYPEAHSLRPAAAPLPGVVAQTLVQTTEDSWAESSFSGNPAFGEGDKPGPVSIAVAATLPVAAPEPSPTAGASLASPLPDASGLPQASPVPSPSPSPGEEAAPAPRREGRVVAFGDSDFASNAFLKFPGNRDLLLNTIAWLAEDADLITIRPRDPEDQRLDISLRQQWSIYLLALLLLPGLFIVLGIRTWWTRR